MRRHIDRHDPQRRFVPLRIAIAIAAVSLLGLAIIINRGPWNRPQVQGPKSVNLVATKAAAQAAGATVSPTAAEAALEPVAPGPKPVEPAKPSQP